MKTSHVAGNTFTQVNLIVVSDKLPVAPVIPGTGTHPVTATTPMQTMHNNFGVSVSLGL